MKRFLFSVICTLSITGLAAQASHCDGSRYTEIVFDELTETLDVKFGENITVSGETKELLVDIFEPAGDDIAVRPFVLLLHGGAYVGGEKESLHDVCREYAKRGYVAATMAYRLFDGPLIPLPDSTDLVEVVVQSVEDTYAALRYFINDAADENVYGIDTDMIFVGGVSAGGITAIHTAYMDEEDDIPSFMADFIDPEFGLGGNSNDLTDITPEIKGILNFSGAIYNVSWMDDKDEPIFSAHDDGDNVVPYGVGYATPFFGIPLVSLQGSLPIEQKATELGIVNELVTFENSLGHVSYFNNLSSANATEVFTKSSLFLEGIVCEGISSTNNRLGLETFKAFPNPSTAMITLEFEESLGLEYIEIYNQLGQLVSLRSTDEQSSLILSKEDIGSGMFIIKGKNKNQLEVLKPVKVIFN
jgi:para-nitrobenzyl esterase